MYLTALFSNIHQDCFGTASQSPRPLGISHADTTVSKVTLELETRFNQLYPLLCFCQLCHDIPCKNKLNKISLLSVLLLYIITSNAYIITGCVFIHNIMFVITYCCIILLCTSVCSTSKICNKRLIMSILVLLHIMTHYYILFYEIFISSSGIFGSAIYICTSYLAFNICYIGIEGMVQSRHTATS